VGWKYVCIFGGKASENTDIFLAPGRSFGLCLSTELQSYVNMFGWCLQQIRKHHPNMFIRGCELARMRWIRRPVWRLVLVFWLSCLAFAAVLGVIGVEMPLLPALLASGMIAIPAGLLGISVLGREEAIQPEVQPAAIAPVVPASDRLDEPATSYPTLHNTPPADSDARMRRVLADLAVGVLVHGADGRITFSNAASSSILQIDAEGIPGRRLSDLPIEIVDETDRALDPGVWPAEQARSTRHSIHGQVIGLRPVGSLHPTWLLVHAVPQFDHAGRLDSVVCSFHDITERRILEQRLRQSQKMEAVGRLAGGIAHDFNNILTVITGGCDLILLDRMRYDIELIQDIEQIRQASQRAGELTRQLLAFSRQQALQPRYLNLNEVVSNVERLLRRLIGEDVTLEVVLGQHMWTVRADPGQIEQVIINLAVNARDAMPNGGTLSITTASVSLPDTHLPQLDDVQPGDYVRLQVADTGMGIPDDLQSQVFEPFFTTKPQGRGTGLGLSTVHGIVTQSGGRITFDSQVEQGTCFSLYLPRATPMEHSWSHPAAVSDQVGGDETVLVVEDDQAVCQLVQRVLAQHGYDVLVASDGKTALQTAATHPNTIDLLITDMVLPGALSGAQIATRLVGLHTRMHVIYMSGYTDDSVSSDGIIVSGLFLRKPFSAEKLVRVVREVLDVKVRG
jgi:PAS domain S-box-containing protein